MKGDLDDLGYELPELIRTGPNEALPIGGGRGVCASFFSLDELDRAALDFAGDVLARNNGKARAADVGCSPFFPMAARFARLGCEVDAFDIEAAVPQFSAINAKLGCRIQYHVGDIVGALGSLSGPYSLVYANRLISHLQFSEAQNLFRAFRRASTSDAHFFFSLSTLDSDLGENYPDASKPVFERFSPVRNPRAEENQIATPFCLYRPSDLDVLLSDLEIEPIRQFTSASGSMKVIARAR